MAAKEQKNYFKGYFKSFIRVEIKCTFPYEV